MEQTLKDLHGAGEHRKPLEYTHGGSVNILGFWLFLATDLMVFATLFATYLILKTHTDGGPTAAGIFDIPGYVAETFILLTSSFTCGLATYSMRKNAKAAALTWLAITMALGLAFVGLEASEFAKDVADGATMQRSAFLSAFYTLVGTHGAHVSLGILWMASLFFQIARRGFDAVRARKLFVVGLYWHFLDIVWVFIFTVVYTMGVR
ncbi:cytochrome (ubi)quinol oxidase subunit III [Alicyclobacillus contaminans]|uniref:cytochrome (ubi)quinol oxidase subunit III n=1 Tax=Alicyclobacillus contaminans TaxID=392016 RepID=UPI00047A3ADA